LARILRNHFPGILVLPFQNLVISVILKYPDGFAIILISSKGFLAKKMSQPNNLWSILAATAQRAGGKTALVQGERRITFADLERAAAKVAQDLVRAGVKKGDRVAIMMNSNPEFVAAFFAVMQAGGIAVPLDTRYVTDETVSVCQDCTPSLVIYESAFTEQVQKIQPRCPSIKNVIAIDESIFNQTEVKSNDVKIDVTPDDIAIISYTGGPTFHPHGVALSHQSLVTEVISSVETFEQTENDVFMLFALPMYHQFGLTAVLLASVYTGNKVVVVPGTGRSIETFMEAIEREKGTVYCGVPYIYTLMINVARRVGVQHNLSSMRLLARGGAPLEPIVINQFKRYYNMDIRDIYGQTESICHCTVMPIHGTGKIGSSGKTLRCWEMKIYDEHDKEMPAGQEGEIVLRGPVMSSFWQHPEKTAEVLRNGWLHTGDMGWIDKEGYLFITARKRRMLVLKGQNVFPSDIEHVLAQHPKIAAAKVVGTIDLVRGETVKALVKLKPGQSADEHEIRLYCQGRMADYKLPREIEFVEDIPEELPLWRRREYTEADAKSAALD
jgi:long-chain acyl-CoA synthetase